MMQSKGLDVLFSIFKIMAKSHQTQSSMFRVKYGCMQKKLEGGYSVLKPSMPTLFASKMNFSQFSTLFASPGPNYKVLYQR